MNTYADSEGNRYTTPQIDRLVTKAKGQVLQAQVDEHGYNFCTECERNDCKPIDCSHEVSVKEAKETGRAELCWDINNITPVGRKCHQRKDGLDIQSSR